VSAVASLSVVSVRILRNSLFGMVARAVDTVMRMVIVAFIARYLGTTGFGEFASIMATTAFVLALTDFGLEPILVRDLSKVGANRERILGGILSLRVLMGGVVLAAMALIVTFSGWSQPVRLAIMLSSLGQVLTAGQMAMLGVFRAHERMEYDTAASLLYQGVSFGFTLVAIAVDGGFLGIVVSQVAGETVKLILLSGWVQRRFLRLRLVWDVRQMAHNLREALPIAGMALTSVVSFRMNVIMLTAWQGPRDVALFDSAQRLFFSISMIPMMILVAVFPVLCRLAGQDWPALRRTYAATFKYLLILGLAVTAVLAVWAEPIMNLLYGRSFAAAASSMRWLGLSTVAWFLIPLTNFVMTSVGRQSWSIAGVLAGVLVNVVVNIFSVPSYGHEGAAIGFFVGALVAAGVNGGLVRHVLGPCGLTAVAWRPLVAGAVMAAVSAAVGTGSVVRMAVGLGLATVVFGAALFALRAISVADLATLKAMRGVPPVVGEGQAGSPPPLREKG